MLDVEKIVWKKCVNGVRVRFGEENGFKMEKNSKSEKR